MVEILQVTFQIHRKKKQNQYQNTHASMTVSRLVYLRLNDKQFMDQNTRPLYLDMDNRRSLGQFFIPLSYPYALISCFFIYGGRWVDSYLNQPGRMIITVLVSSFYLLFSTNVDISERSVAVKPIVIGVTHQPQI